MGPDALACAKALLAPAHADVGSVSLACSLQATSYFDY